MIFSISHSRQGFLTEMSQVRRESYNGFSLKPQHPKLPQRLAMFFLEGPVRRTDKKGVDLARHLTKLPRIFGFEV